MKPEIGNVSLVQLAWCRRWADTVMARKPSTPNYTGVHQPERFYTGYKGECGAWTWFEGKQVDYRYTVNLRGYAAEPEFTIPLDGVRCTFDVKTNGVPTGPDFIVSELQRIKMKEQHIEPEFYIGARLTANERVVELWGWATRAEVAAMPISDRFGSDCRWTLLTKLHDLELLRLEADLTARDRFFLIE